MFVVQPRPVNWNEEYFIMHIDNAVRHLAKCVDCTYFYICIPGFSFDDGYFWNEEKIADTLYGYVC